MIKEKKLILITTLGREPIGAPTVIKNKNSLREREGTRVGEVGHGPKALDIRVHSVVML